MPARAQIYIALLINPETPACQRDSGEDWWASPPLSGLLTIIKTPTIRNYEREFGSEGPYDRRAKNDTG